MRENAKVLRDTEQITVVQQHLRTVRAEAEVARMRLAGVAPAPAPSRSPSSSPSP
jgi:hypothetical protein